MAPRLLTFGGTMKKFFCAMFAAIVFVGSFAGLRVNPSANSSGEQPSITDFRQGVIDGRCFYVSPSAKASSIQLLFTTGSIQPRVSISHSIFTTGTLAAYETTLKMYEGSVCNPVGSTGTVQTVYNLNRGSTVTPTSVVSLSPGTMSSYVTLLPEIIGYSGTVGDFYGRQEFTPAPGCGGSSWLLKANTQYRFIATPSVTTSTLYLYINWKE